MATRHAPSHARALVQEAKRPGGRNATELLAEARTIPDAGHAAEAIARIVHATELPPTERAAAATEALTLAMTVERTWRRIEVFGTILESVDHPDVERRILESVSDVPPGEGRSSAIAVLTPHVSRDGLHALFTLAATNGTQAGEDTKSVLRVWTRIGRPTSILAAIEAVADASLRARLLAFVAHRKPEWAEDEADLAPRVVEAALAVDDAAKALESWRTLFQQADSRDAVDALRAGLEQTDDAIRVALASTIVGRLYKDRRNEEAAAAGDQALGELDKLPDDPARLRLCQNLVRAFTRANDAPRTTAAMSRAEAILATIDPATAAGYRAKLAKAAGQEPPSKPATARTLPRPDPTPAPSNDATSPNAPSAPDQTSGNLHREMESARPTATPRTGKRHALGLHATYDGGVSRAHLQAVARAAPLCDGFELDLVLFGFPFDDVDQLVQAVAAETNIGGGGQHIQRLAAGGHVHLVACPDGAPPPDDGTWGQFVATTPRPLAGHRHTLLDAKSAATSEKAAGRICVIMGLGRSGLPRGWLEAIPFHYEITNSDISLETATAMGILADRVRSLGAPA